MWQIENLACNILYLADPKRFFFLFVNSGMDLVKPSTGSIMSDTGSLSSVLSKNSRKNLHAQDFE